MLSKVIADVRACKDLAESRLEQIAARDAVLAVSEREKLYYVELVELLEKRIRFLEKIKCSEFKIFFFFKYKKCSL